MGAGNILPAAPSLYARCVWIPPATYTSHTTHIRRLTMKTAGTLFLGAATMLCLTALTARAQTKMYQGRTGLPTVKEGSEKIWIERGTVSLEVRGGDLYVTQDYRLHYPGGKIEKGMDRSRVAVREDFFRSTDNHVPPVTAADAKGFTRFAVWIDRRP